MPAVGYREEMDLSVADAFVIPESELGWSFSTSGAPGGQHANRNATRAELSWDLAASDAVGEELRARLTTALGTRVRDGVVSITVGESRSQWRNRQLARRRLAELLEGALHERRRRLPTRPSRSATDARIKDKRRRGADKRLRKPPEIE
ncbi:MAG: alternative ribosome rescue aminoacyl-tRNA hydrolase ArfB [Acidimicrobiia bacterium]|nr:alternative ribosome rescue aminoacyl-tRNA hydrolase ArfB [Acidimicrobiia bacterium]